MSKVIINGRDYTDNTQLGMVLNDTLTEELDSMTIIINDIPKTQFEPFQEAEIQAADGSKYHFYVNTTDPELFDYENKTYSYTIALISQTKILERINIPNLKIRKPITGHTKTIRKYLEKVVMSYVDRQYPGMFKLSDEIIELIDDVECPEISWGKGTNVKQVMNDLLMTIPGNPCVVKVANGYITYVSLAPDKERHKDVRTYNNLKIIDNNPYQQMSDFANNITMDVQNIIPTEKNASAIISPRANGEITTDNCDLIIPNAQIDTINYLYVTCRIREKYEGLAGTDERNYTFDITEYVCEESIFNGKLTADYWTDIFTNETSLLKDTASKYKICNLYFKQGGNTIKGIGQRTSFSFINTITTIQRIIQVEHWKYNEYRRPEGLPKAKWDGLVDDIRDLIFTISYNNIGSIRIKIAKDNPEDVDCSIYQGQNQAAIDFKAITKTQREAVNRLGNEIIKLPMICNLNAIPVLGDYIDEDYILTQRQIAYYNDFAIVNGTFAKNYVQKNLYYGVSTRRKYTQLAQATESVTREDVHILNVHYSSEYEDIMYEYETMTIAMASFFEGENKTIRTIRLRTNVNEDKGAYLFATSYVGDKTLSITAECEDNYSVGMQVVYDGTHRVPGYVKYVDSQGEIESYKIWLFHEAINPTKENCRAFPEEKDGMIDGNAVSLYTKEREFYKDNGETLKITLQFNFLSDDESIIIGDAIGNQNVLSPGGDFSKCKLYYATDEKVDKQYPVITNGFIEIENKDIEVEDNKIFFTSIIMLRAQGIDIQSYALVDEYGEIILAVNKDENNRISTRLYINVKGE